MGKVRRKESIIIYELTFDIQNDPFWYAGRNTISRYTQIGAHFVSADFC